MIHCYKLNGYNIVLDIHSGAVHVLDELSYAIVSQLPADTDDMPATCPLDISNALAGTYTLEEIEDAYTELYGLYESDVLFSKDDYAQFADQMVSAPVKAMCLHVAHDCNLRCGYCFAAQGDFGHGRKLMPLEVGKRAIDFLIARSEGRKNLELDFFGGEPLMNLDVVKEIVSYARSLESKYNKHFRFTITTNGILLDDNAIDFINREMHNVVLSIDGRKSVNDKLRYTANQHGSYDVIMPKFRNLVEKRGDGQYYVRGTFTKYNLDFMQDVEHLYQEGFDQISVEPVVADASLPYALTQEDMPAVFAEYERLAKKMIERKRAGNAYNFFHFMIDLDQGPCAIKRLRGCGCGNEYVAVTPEGDIYPCHQFVGMEEWKMGSVLDGSFDLERKQAFAKANVYTKRTCKSCWAKFYCSGGCNANNQQYAGDILSPYTPACELEKKRLECAIMIKAALAEA